LVNGINSIMKFTEEKLETAFIELLGNEKFPHHLGVTIKRQVDEVCNQKLTMYSFR
jgi:hypothetical protein